MPELMVLKCPVCGAPLSSGDTHCPFCGSTIVIKADTPALNLKNLNQSVIQEHIADFRTRIRKDRYDVEAHYGLGMAYYSLGLGDEAIEELTNAAKLMPENVNIQTQLAIVLHQAVLSGKTSAEVPMRERLAKALALDPGNVDANLLRAELLQRQGDDAGALRVIRSVVASDPERANPRRVEILERLGRQAQRNNDARAFALILGELRETGNEATVRDLLITSIHQRRDGLDTAVVIAPSGHDARMAEDLADKAVSWLKTILVGVGTLVVGVIILMIVAVTLPTGADGKATSGASLTFGLLLLVWLGSPFVAGWLYRRQVRKRRAVWDDRLGRRISRDDILGGTISTDDLIAVDRLLATRGEGHVAIG